MKKCTVIALLVACICTLLHACSFWDSASVDTQISAVATTQTSMEDIYCTIEAANSVYTKFTSESQELFYQAIANNSIDRAYEDEIVGSSTTEMVRKEIKYAEIWKIELERTIESFIIHLDDNQKKQFLDLQYEWESWLVAEMKFVQDLSGGEMYKAQFGSVFSIECANKYKESIRERSIYIKYLQFCMEDSVVFYTP